MDTAMPGRLLAGALVGTIAIAAASCGLPYMPDFDYRSVLAASPPYDEAVDDAFPGFSYQAADAADLVALEARYGIAGIAGTGTDLERMARVMHWIDDVTRQDGSVPPPEPRTALNLIYQSAERGAALNCLATAICLSESLLSIGIRARTLTLYPRDRSPDCHVVVTAWCSELSKWVFLDPSYDTALFDDAGTPLDPMEIREALAAGTALAFSEGAGWNGGAFDLDYLHYLSKNFYGFYSPPSSAVGSNDHPGTLYHLTPVGVEPPPVWFKKTVVTHSPYSFFAPPP